MRAVFFDLDGTLLHLDDDYGTVLKRAFESAVGRVEDAWLAAYDEGFRARFGECAPEPYRGGVEHLRETTDFDGDPDALVGALVAAEVEGMSPAPGAADALADVASDYRVGVLTNGVPEVQREKLAAHGLYEHVETVVASYEAGSHKPDRAPFDLAADRLPADGYGMVGDSDDDVSGARNAGWAAARYDGGELGDVPASLGWR